MDGFGLFNDVTVKDIPPGIVLFLGNNEAGKSTLLNFVHTVLFGYPDGRSSEKDYPALNGGTPGGRLFLDTDTHGSVIVERRDGVKGGRVTLSLEDGETGGADVLEKILGGTNRKLFRNLYGFSLTELQTIETLTSEDVRDVIYGASLGTGLRTLPEARRRLDKRIGELFKGGGSKPKINGLLKRIEYTRRELKDAQKGIGEYEETGANIVTLTADIGATQKELAETRQRRSHVQALCKLWDDWVDLCEAENLLAGLDLRVEEFPAEGLTTLDGKLQVIARERTDLRTADDDLAALRKELEGLAFDEALLGQSAEISGLIKGLETYEKAVKAIPTAEDRGKACEAYVKDLLTELGAGWTEERALGLDRSAHVKEEISTHKKILAEAEGHSATFDTKRKSCEEASEECKQEEKRAQEKVSEFEGTGLEVDQAVLEELRSGKDQFSSVLKDLPSNEDKRKTDSENFTRTLREIAPDWTAETLQKLDVSLPAQQKIERFETRLLDTDAAIRDARTAVTTTEGRATKIQRATVEKRAALEALTGEVKNVSDFEARRSRARGLQRTASHYAAVEAELIGKKQTLKLIGAEQVSTGSPDVRRLLRNFAVGITVVGLVAAAVLFAIDQKEAAGVCAGLSILITVGLLISRNGLTPVELGPRRVGVDLAEVERQAAELTEQLEAVACEINEIYASLGADDSLDLTDADGLLDRINTQIDLADDGLRLARDIEDLTVELELAKTDLENAKLATKEAEAKLASTTKEWEAHARALHLPADTSPRTAGLVFAKVEKARGEQNQIGELTARIQKMKDARSDYLTIMAKAPRLEKVIDKKDGAILKELTKFLTEIDQQDGRLRDLELARRAAKDTTARTALAAKKFVQANDDLVAAREAQGRAEAGWEQWLEQHDMDGGWSPDTAAHALDRAIRLADIVSDRKSAVAVVARDKNEIERFRKRAAAVSAAIGRPAPGDSELAVELIRLEENRDEDDKRRIRHAQLEKELEKAEPRCKTRRDSIKRVEAELGELVNAGGAKNEDEFRRRGEAHEQFRKHSGTITASESSIRKISGVLDLTTLKVELAGESRDRLLAEEAELEGQFKAIEASLAAAFQGQGSAVKEQQALYSDDRVAQLRATEEGLLEELAVLARDWARHAVANHLLTAAKERHAQANQPRVIQEAGKYFETITGGRYSKVFAPPGEDSIEVIDPEGRSKNANDLSRGSMEQLYLAIRFGYISAQPAGSEPLPILMDDVLVNFDPTRAAAAAAGISQMAESRQILFFTCHPSVVDILREHYQQLPVFEIAEEGISRRA